MGQQNVSPSRIRPVCTHTWTRHLGVHRLSKLTYAWKILLMSIWERFKIMVFLFKNYGGYNLVPNLDTTRVWSWCMNQLPAGLFGTGSKASCWKLMGAGKCSQLGFVGSLSQHPVDGTIFENAGGPKAGSQTSWI